MSVVKHLNDRLNGNWKGFLRSYLVGSAKPPSRSPRSWLVCESPHVDEVRECCPLIGRTGKTVTNAFVHAGLLEKTHCGMPIGTLIKSGTINWLGVINASELPLQWRTYARLMSAKDWDCVVPKDFCFRDWAILMLAFDNVRKYTTKTTKPHDDALEHELLEDFRNRINGDIRKEHRVLLCGDVAEAFWKLVRNHKIPKGKKVPHPSARGKSSWRMSNGKDKVAKALRWLAQDHTPPTSTS